ncbi:MAG: phosphoserine phosphatase RsbU/P [Gaiellales bacterium]|nr:phosphoserine phosphatase RsbU/P [Gaiellales bacterium]
MSVGSARLNVGKPAEVRVGELERLSAVRRYDVLDTPPDGAFDRITALAARIFEVPIALVTIVDHDRIWFKSRLGTDATQIDRDPGLCASAILHHSPYVVTDAITDPRTLANPLVAGEMGLRFYAAAPLTTPDGFNLGTVCVLDTHAREVTAHELETLSDLAAIVVDELELRRSAKRVHDQESELLDAATSFARTLQQSLLPARLPELEGLDLAAYFRASDPREVGGDFYDAFSVGEGRSAFVVGDVAGKGPSAAAATSLVRNALRMAALDAAGPGEALEAVNRALRRSEYFGVRRRPGYCTVALAFLDTTGATCRVTIARAGHVRPLIVRADGATAESTADGPLLGMTEDVTFETEQTMLAENDLVVMYTDGLTEARNGADEVGVGPLKDVVSRLATRPAVEVIRGIEGLVGSFGPGVRDDVAILAVRATP